MSIVMALSITPLRSVLTNNDVYASKTTNARLGQPCYSFSNRRAMRVKRKLVSHLDRPANITQWASDKNALLQAASNSQERLHQLCSWQLSQAYSLDCQQALLGLAYQAPALFRGPAAEKINVTYKFIENIGGSFSQSDQRRFDNHFFLPPNIRLFTRLVRGDKNRSENCSNTSHCHEPIRALLVKHSKILKNTYQYEKRHKAHKQGPHAPNAGFQQAFTKRLQPRMFIQSHHAYSPSPHSARSSLPVLNGNVQHAAAPHAPAAEVALDYTHPLSRYFWELRYEGAA